MSSKKVSILCTAYNHENYIRQALESFVAQKTDFDFEVLVHDDASTDGTAGIIREYAEKYPDIVKPVFQTENQYSKGVRINADIMAPIAEGEYLAFCEGDDFLCDDEKLESQVRFLDSHPEYSACCHAFSRFDDTEGRFASPIHSLNEDGDLSVDFMINNRKTPQIATFMVRKEVFRAKPEYCFLDSVGDYSHRIWFALSGKVRYIDREMSCYRLNSSGSWTRKTRNSTVNQICWCERRLEYLSALDQNTGGKYSDTISSVKDQVEYILLYRRGDYRAAYRCSGYRSAPKSNKAVIALGRVFPRLTYKFISKGSGK